MKSRRFLSLLLAFAVTLSVLFSPGLSVSAAVEVENYFLFTDGWKLQYANNETANTTDQITLTGTSSTPTFTLPATDRFFFQTNFDLPSQEVTIRGRIQAPCAPASFFFLGNRMQFDYVNGFIYFEGTGVFEKGADRISIYCPTGNPDAMEGQWIFDYCYIYTDTFADAPVKVWDKKYVYPTWYSWEVVPDSTDYVVQVGDQGSWMDSPSLSQNQLSWTKFNIPVADLPRHGIFQLDVLVDAAVVVSLQALSDTGPMIPVDMYTTTDYTYQHTNVNTQTGYVQTGTSHTVIAWEYAEDPLSSFVQGNVYANNIATSSDLQMMDTTFTYNQEFASVATSMMRLRFDLSSVPEAASNVEIIVFALASDSSLDVMGNNNKFLVKSAGVYYEPSDAMDVEQSIFADWLRSVYDWMTRTIVNAINGLKSVLQELPDKIAEAITSVFVPDQAAVEEFTSQTQDMLKDSFGGVYESVEIVDNYVGSITVRDPKRKLDFPAVTVNLSGVPFTFGGWQVDVIPEGFEGIVETLKVIIDIVCTLAFINSIKGRFENIMDGDD